MNLDLESHHQRIVERILSDHVPEAVVYAFGSRTRGDAKPHSDLDLVIRAEAPVDARRMAALTLAFEDSDLPFRVDVLDWHTTGADFRQRIEQDCVAIQPGKRGRLEGASPLTLVAPPPPPNSREDLVAALHERGLCYLAPTPTGCERALSDDELIVGLAASKDARLRFALAGLLLLHPHLAERVADLVEARQANADAPGNDSYNGNATAAQAHDPVVSELQKQYLAAMYLQRMWRTRLRMHFGETPLIPERYTKALNLPPADAMFGEMGLRALTERSPYNDWSSYEQVVSLLCDQPCATNDDGRWMADDAESSEAAARQSSIVNRQP